MPENKEDYLTEACWMDCNRIEPSADKKHFET